MKGVIAMMQGDACYLAIRILNNAGNPVTPDQIMDLEITLGPLRRTYLRQEILFGDGLWLFPLTQEKSFALWPSQVKAQVRILWNNGVVEGKPIASIPVMESISREVL